MKALDEIREREKKASDEIARLTTGNPGANWRWSIPANSERDSDLILADSIADVARLLAAVEGVESRLAHWEERFTGMASDEVAMRAAIYLIRKDITEALEAKP